MRTSISCKILGTHLLDSYFSVGSFIHRELTKLEQKAIEHFTKLKGKQFVFNRLRINQEIIHSIDYERSAQRINYCIAFTNPKSKEAESYGLVRNFVHFNYSSSNKCLISNQSTCRKKQVFAFIFPLKRQLKTLSTDEMTLCSVPNIILCHSPSEEKVTAILVD